VNNQRFQDKIATARHLLGQDNFRFSKIARDNGVCVRMGRINPTYADRDQAYRWVASESFFGQCRDRSRAQPRQSQNGRLWKTLFPPAVRKPAEGILPAGVGCSATAAPSSSEPETRRGLQG
jgi:hypothetical protein